MRHRALVTEIKEDSVICLNGFRLDLKSGALQVNEEEAVRVLRKICEPAKCEGCRTFFKGAS